MDNSNERYSVSDKEFELLYMRIKTIVINQTDAKPVQDGKPLAVVLGGQPGAGKHNVYEFYQRLLENGIVGIDCDEFRQYHPYYEKIYEECLVTKGNPSLMTNQFVYDVSDRLIQELSDEGYNMVIESTLRTPDVAKNLVSTSGFNLKDKGYDVNLSVVGTDKATSLQGTIARYESQLKVYNEYKSEGLPAIPPRSVPQDFHDSVVESIAKSLNDVYKSGLMDEIKIFSRSGECFYTMTDTPDLNPVPILSARLHHSEQEAKVQIDAYVSEYKKTLNQSPEVAQPQFRYKELSMQEFTSHRAELQQLCACKKAGEGVIVRYNASDEIKVNNILSNKSLKNIKK